MLREKLLSKIEEIQKENELISHYKKISEVCDPGETGFQCKRVGSSGYLLISDIPVKPRKRKIIIENKPNVLSLEDFRGVHPYIAIVMESSSDTIKAGDVVVLDAQSMKQGAQDIVVKGALATIIPETYCLGVDTNYRL